MAYCEHCEQEHEGVLCPVCGGEMLQEIDPEQMMPPEGAEMDPLEQWPTGPDGMPERAVSLENVADFASYGGMAAARLMACGIPVLTGYAQADSLARLYGGFALGGVGLYVPESRLEEARSLLEQ